jgi:hypothetical protein
MRDITDRRWALADCPHSTCGFDRHVEPARSIRDRHPLSPNRNTLATGSTSRLPDNLNVARHDAGMPSATPDDRQEHR